MADQLDRLIGRHAITLLSGEGGETNDGGLLLPTLLQQLFALAGGVTVLLVVVIETGQPQVQCIILLERQCRLVAGDGTGPVGLLGLNIAAQSQQLELLLLGPLFIGKGLFDITARQGGLLQIGCQRGLQLRQPGTLGIAIWLEAGCLALGLLPLTRLIELHHGFKLTGEVRADLHRQTGLANQCQQTDPDPQHSYDSSLNLSVMTCTSLSVAPGLG